MLLRAFTHDRARSGLLAKKIKKPSCALVLQLISGEGGAHQIHFKPGSGDAARCNQRSASNPVLLFFPSHKQHLKENIHGHLQREEKWWGGAHLDIALFSIQLTMAQRTPGDNIEQTRMQFTVLSLMRRWKNTKMYFFFFSFKQH